MNLQNILHSCGIFAQQEDGSAAGGTAHVQVTASAVGRVSVHTPVEVDTTSTC